MKIDLMGSKKERKARRKQTRGWWRRVLCICLTFKLVRAGALASCSVLCLGMTLRNHPLCQIFLNEGRGRRGINSSWIRDHKAGMRPLSAAWPLDGCFCYFSSCFILFNTFIFLVQLFLCVFLTCGWEQLLQSLGWLCQTFFILQLKPPCFQLHHSKTQQNSSDRKEVAIDFS